MKQQPISFFVPLLSSYLIFVKTQTVLHDSSNHSGSIYRSPQFSEVLNTFPEEGVSYPPLLMYQEVLCLFLQDLANVPTLRGRCEIVEKVRYDFEFRFHFVITHNQINSDGHRWVICSGIIFPSPITNLKVIVCEESELTSYPSTSVFHVECILQCLIISIQFELIRDQVISEFFSANITLKCLPFKHRLLRIGIR